MSTPHDAGQPPPEEAEVQSEGSVPFVVGKLGKDDRRMVVLEEKTPPPIAGPFELRAVFSK